MKGAICILLLCNILALVIIEDVAAQFLPESAFDYDVKDKEGPKNWHNIAAACGTGKSSERQSPIDLSHDESTYTPNFGIIKQRHNKLNGFDMENVGYTIRLDINGTRTSHYLEVEGLLSGRYIGEFVHFHWTLDDDDDGTDHTFSTKGGWMELQGYYYHEKFRDFNAAVSSGEKDALAVVSVIYKEGEADSELEKMTQFLGLIKPRGGKVKVRTEALDLENIFPDKTREFYTYEGSIPIPSCNEIVRWIVFRNHKTMSKNQIIQFRNTSQSSGGTTLIGSPATNSRPVQPRNGRTVIRNFDDNLFDYDDKSSSPVGPRSWHNLAGSKCGKRSSSERQSPINIVNPIFDKTLQRLDFLYQTIFRYELHNDGYTVVLPIRGTSSTTFLEVGGLLEGRYTLDHVAFHWNHDRFHHGTEHEINSRGEDLEMQFYHYSSKFSSYSDAAKSSDADAIAAVAILFTRKHDNKAIRKITDNLSQIRRKGQRTTINHDIHLEEFFPTNLDYYTYLGSLTTPNCHENVRWIVLREHQPISSNELDEFRKLYADGIDRKKVAFPDSNARETQPLNNRLVSRNFPDTKKTPSVSPTTTTSVNEINNSPPPTTSPSEPSTPPSPPKSLVFTSILEASIPTSKRPRKPPPPSPTPSSVGSPSTPPPPPFSPAPPPPPSSATTLYTYNNYNVNVFNFVIVTITFFVLFC